MKNNNYFKKTMLVATLVIAALLITSCGNRQSSQDSKDVAEDRNEERFDDRKQVNDAQLLVDAAEFNLMQIQLGQLAQQKGSTSNVKELGKMMEEAHTKLQRDLTAFAGRKSMTIPTTPTENVRDTYKDLNEKSGNDFDKAYGDIMVNKHEDAIKKFEKATTDRNDTDIVNWAIAMLPGLRSHLNHSIESKKKSDELASN
ncbi:DUF4142 domain-containing protein [Natronoflexus pectinivorans]|uniref:Putative membrane protein n=1 Tax=Natronoflexus pectinivorans TaxID=682526 RepID=A0A4R2GSB6_9BACT|nr:DUF4142 domain-containing protein [Natronoflexus pectinivorans]TCO11096.1 putative membrane protein [Natronoflexus pectinivorans]